MPQPLRTIPLPDGPEEAIQAVRQTLSRLRFGSIAITVHEGRIVQLDIAEKRRLVR